MTIRNEQEPRRDMHGPEDASGEIPRPFAFRHLLNILIGLLLIVVGYFAYAYLDREVRTSGSGKPPLVPARVIQLDVLNGCGAHGAGAKITNLLRGSGFDVVEMKNYKTFNIPRTLVVDRIGNLTQARRVADALGISESSIIQQINPDYFVDVSVIVGQDYAILHGTH